MSVGMICLGEHGERKFCSKRAKDLFAADLRR